MHFQHVFYFVTPNLKERNSGINQCLKILLEIRLSAFSLHKLILDYGVMQENNDQILFFVLINVILFLTCD